MTDPPLPSDPTAPNAHRFSPLDADTAEQWATFLAWEDQTFFPTHLGMRVEEIRNDYARLRLPFRPEFNQPAGLLHGGALASLIDTVVVPAVATAYEGHPMLATISMEVQYLAPVVAQDAIAEGWVTKRGRSTVFCRSEIRIPDGELTTTATLIYKVSQSRQVDVG